MHLKIKPKLSLHHQWKEIKGIKVWNDSQLRAMVILSLDGQICVLFFEWLVLDTESYEKRLAKKIGMAPEN